MKYVNLIKKYYKDLPKPSPPVYGFMWRDRHDAKLIDNLAKLGAGKLFVGDIVTCHEVTWEKTSNAVPKALSPSWRLGRVRAIGGVLRFAA